MTIADMFAKEDRVDVTYSDFYILVKEATKTEIIKEALERGNDPRDILNVMFVKKNNEGICACNLVEE